MGFLQAFFVDNVITHGRLNLNIGVLNLWESLAVL